MRELAEQRAHLRKVSFRGADLTNADLANASLAEADFSCARLTGANLNRASLQDASFRSADMAGARLEDASVLSADFTDAFLPAAKLSRATLRDTKFCRAVLGNADPFNPAMVHGLSDRDGLRRALWQAALRHTNPTGAGLSGADLSGADLLGADFTGAALGQVNFAGADLRGVRGLRLDRSYIRDARFSPVVGGLLRFARARYSDSWSVLRQTYAGPRLTFLLVGVIAFALPYIGRTMFWNAVGHLDYVVATEANVLHSRLDAELRTVMQKLQQDPAVSEPAKLSGERLLESLRVALREAAQRSHDRVTQRRVYELMLMLDRGWAAVFVAGLLIVYNICVWYLVRRVSSLRDEEERSGYSPAWREYRLAVVLHGIGSVLFYVAIGSFVWNIVEALSAPVWVWRTT